MKNQNIEWPKKSVSWVRNRVQYISIPFTWELPEIADRLQQRSLFHDSVLVGGPAVYLMPGYFDSFEHVSIGYEMPGILQRVNPLATRTTVGCIRKCKFCGVSKFEGSFKELSDWPDLPVICDNNILAASQKHLDRVFDRLENHGWADFNQGLDTRLLNSYHAERLVRIRPMVRLALDNMRYADQWENAFALLRSAGLPKSCIRSYAIIGFDSNPDEAWKRCNWVESHGIKVLPMWFHELNQTEKNIVTEDQKKLGWNDFERKRIMGWFYKHRMLQSAA